MTRSLVAALVLFSLPVSGSIYLAKKAGGAGPEILAPDDTAANSSWRESDNTACGTRCDTATCETSIDEDPASPDGLLVSTITNNQELLIDFPTPASNPSTATTAQVFDINVSPTDGSCIESVAATPNYDVALYCNGVNKGDIATAIDITGTGQNDSYSWTYTTDADCDAAGANVQIGIQSHRISSHHVTINAVEWESQP